MKQQENKTQNEREAQECATRSCSSCEICAKLDFEDARGIEQERASQLYGTEAEHYFFYFPDERKAG